MREGGLSISSVSSVVDKNLRLFAAIELPAHVRHKVRLHIDRLRAELSDVRASWIREENLHLTLKFFGDTPVEKVETLSQALNRAAKRLDPFEIEIGGCGSFPPRGKPKVLWIGIAELTTSPLPLGEDAVGGIADGPAPVLSAPPAVAGGYSGSLGTLNAALEDECARVGFPRDGRPFHPHLTIARLRQPSDARALAQLHREIGFESLIVGVKAICLIQSELSRAGSRYTVIARHDFN